MELIPILSTIILVATICTFILAIGAYILYKIREGRQQPYYVAKPSTVQAELVVPAESLHEQELQEQKEKRRAPGIIREEAPLHKKSTNQKHVPPKVFKINEEQRAYRKTTGIKEKLSDENKFLKYTSEGYVSPKEDRSSGAVKWR